LGPLRSEQALGFELVAVQIAKLLAFDFDFGEDNFPFVAYFLHFVALLFAGLVGSCVLLPFEHLA
jgi:hypothetical protein